MRAERIHRLVDQGLNRPLDRLLHDRRRVGIAIWVACGLLTLLAVQRFWPMIDGAASGDIRYGEDFLTAVFGPNQLISEGVDPWSVSAAVPRFGSYPATPIIPSSYLAFPILEPIGAAAAVTGWMLISLFITVFGTRAVMRSLALPLDVSMLVALLVVVSPVSLYNIEQGQTGAGLVAAVAFFAIRAHPEPRWWHRPEAWLYIGTIFFFFAKPTFALGFLAAELAYRRTAKLWAAFVAAIVVLGTISMFVIRARTGLSFGDLIESARSAGELLGAAPVNRMDGDRLDVLSLFWPSPALDVVMLAVAVGAVVWVHRLRDTTLHERILLGTTAATLLTYHHIYDTMPLLALTAATAIIWGRWRGVVLGVALVVVGWIDDVNALSTAWQDLVGIDWFVLRSRLVFLLSFAVAAMVVIDHRRRTANQLDRSPDRSGADQ